MSLKDDLIDYVTTTPNNTNPSMVSMLVDQMVQEYDNNNNNMIRIVQNPLSFPSDAIDGTIAVALEDSASEYPVILEAGENNEYNATVGNNEVVFGSPEYEVSAINEKIQHQNVTANGNISLADNTSISFGIFPVIDDISNNAYTNAGIILDSTDAIVAQDSSTLYSILIDLESNFDAIKQAKITTVDESHATAPLYCIYVFENMTWERDNDNTFNLSEGWNVLNVTWNTDKREVEEIVSCDSGVDINDYITLNTDTESMVTVTGTGSQDIFDGLFVMTYDTSAEKGLYVKLNGSWNRCVLE